MYIRINRIYRAKKKKICVNKFNVKRKNIHFFPLTLSVCLYCRKAHGNTLSVKTRMISKNALLSLENKTFVYEGGNEKSLLSKTVYCRLVF
jgi:hypothetical protein